MIAEKVRSLWADRTTETRRGKLGEDDAETGDSEASAKLFSCPDCDVVYIADEKETCSACRQSVTEVSPTLSRG